jgi:selenophosphate synthase
MGILYWFQTAKLNLNQSEATIQNYGKYLLNLNKNVDNMCFPYLNQNVASQGHIISNQKEKEHMIQYKNETLTS